MLHLLGSAQFRVTKTSDLWLLLLLRLLTTWTVFLSSQNLSLLHLTTLRRRCLCWGLLIYGSSSLAVNVMEIRQRSSISSRHSGEVHRDLGPKESSWIGSSDILYLVGS